MAKSGEIARLNEDGTKMKKRIRNEMKCRMQCGDSAPHACQGESVDAQQCIPFSLCLPNTLSKHTGVNDRYGVRMLKLMLFKYFLFVVGEIDEMPLFIGYRLVQLFMKLPCAHTRRETDNTNATNTTASFCHLIAQRTQFSGQQKPCNHFLARFYLVSFVQV